MSPNDKALVFLKGEVVTPPLSEQARREAGFLLRMLQAGEKLSMPRSRPMPSIGRRCHELRINDENQTWRIVYRIDEDAILVLNVFSKKSEQTPKSVLDSCRMILKLYDGILVGWRNRR